jgi:antitoxin component YwqK of YwqJK toxin-antitoxin module
MKHTLLITTALIITALMLVVGFSSGQEPIDGSTLIYKDGLFYAPDSDEPYSGEVVSHYENGQKVRKGTCKDGEVDGKWTYWYENGQKSEERTYKDGEYFLSNSWGKNGKIMVKDGNGVWTYWSPDGKQSSELVYKDGQRWDGKWTTWYENGQKEWEQTYKDGELIEWTLWDDDGTKY